jgi:hypothetical protein
LAVIHAGMKSVRQPWELIGIALVNTDFVIELNNTVFYTFQFDLQLVFRFTRFLLCWKMDGAGLCDWLIVLDVTISDFLKNSLVSTET